MSYHYHAPLDPSCPDVAAFHEMNANDPISQECSCMDEIYETWEARHSAECPRCQEFGAANIEVID